MGETLDGRRSTPQPRRVPRLGGPVQCRRVRAADAGLLPSVSIFPFPFSVLFVARTGAHGAGCLVPPPYRLGRGVERRELFTLWPSEVGPCPFGVKAKSRVRARTHGGRRFVPPAYGLGRRIERRRLFKLRLSCMFACRFDFLVRAGALWSRTRVPPPVLSGGHANRPESQQEHGAETENEMHPQTKMFHKPVTSK